jgi:chemotaxis response regulator CheB
MRIIVAAVPRLLCDILQQAVDQSPDMETVATLAAEEDLQPAIALLQPDVVVMGGSTGADEQAVGKLRRASASVRVVRLSPSGRQATIHGPGDGTVVLEDVSLQELLELLRG